MKPNNTQWNPDLYNQEGDFVSQYGKDLVSLLNPKNHERILDLGCGTGKLTNEISQSCAQVIGIDSSVDMIHEAKKTYPDLIFKIEDGHQFRFDQQFDAIFSNAALHWMNKPEKVIACMFACLKPGGRLVFEMGGKNNLHTLLMSLEQAARKFNLEQLSLENYFPTVGEYSTLLEQQGFRVTRMELYDRFTLMKGEDGLRNWVKIFRSSVLKKIPADQQQLFFQEVEEHARRQLYHESSWWVDYVRLRGIAIKPIGTALQCKW